MSLGGASTPAYISAEIIRILSEIALKCTGNLPEISALYHRGGNSSGTRQPSAATRSFCDKTVTTSRHLVFCLESLPTGCQCGCVSTTSRKKEIKGHTTAAYICFFLHMVHLVDTWTAVHALNCHRDVTNYKAVSRVALVIQ